MIKQGKFDNYKLVENKIEEYHRVLGEGYLPHLFRLDDEIVSSNDQDIEFLHVFNQNYVDVYTFHYLYRKAYKTPNPKVRQVVLDYLSFIFETDEKLFEEFTINIGEDAYYKRLERYSHPIEIAVKNNLDFKDTGILEYIMDGGRMKEYEKGLAVLVSYFIYLKLEYETHTSLTFVETLLHELFGYIANMKIGYSAIKGQLKYISNLIENRCKRFDINISRCVNKALSDKDLKEIILQSTGELRIYTMSLSWKYVTFCNGFLLLYHPNNPRDSHPLSYPILESKSAFNEVSDIFINRLPPIRVKVRNEHIEEVLDIANIKDCIESLSVKSIQLKVKKDKSRMDKKLHNVSQTALLEYIKERDSDYLNYLCEKQLSSYRIYHNKEKRINLASMNTSVYEDAFLFVIAEDDAQVIAIYENVLPSRSSIVFYIYKAHYTQVIEDIGDFFASNEVNKRKQIVFHSIKFDNVGVRKYERVLHTNFYSWKTFLNSLISL